jgi:hypothetical protein
MTSTREGLPPDLIFEPDGHVTDVCVTCVADGEIALVPQAALDHLDACDTCGERLGRAALLSVGAAEALRDLPAQALVEPAVAVVAPVVAAELAQPAPVSPRKLRRPLPIAAIAAALLVAAVTAGPALADAAASLPSFLSGVLGWLPALWHIARAAVVGGPSVLGPWALLIKGVSAMAFVILGLSVARISAHRQAMAVEGGVR